LSSIRQKILSGATLTPEEWASHLVEAHDLAPAMTPRAFATFRNSSGQNSYEVLASVLDKRKGDLHVVDLGCGDGYLIQYLLPRLSRGSRITAVDMVASELARAKAQVRDRRVEFRQVKAQDLALAPGSVDVVLGHLTLMLMRPIEPVLATLKRCLKPGGELAAVIPAPLSPGTCPARIASAIRGFVEEKFPGSPERFRLGDARFESEETLQRLFDSQSGFQQDLWIQDFEIRIPGDAETIWKFYQDTYLVGALPADARAELKRRLAEILAKEPPPGNAYVFPLRLFQVTA
jgi:SAM-dependent methyltransferase